MQKFIKQMQAMGKPIALQLLLGLIGIPVGIIIGAMDTAFGKILLEITGIRELYPLYLIPALPLAGILIAFCYQKFGGTSSKGMTLIFEVGHGDEEKIPLRLIPFVVGSTWITHLFGGSAGREGVAVQIGATFSHWIGRHLPIKNAGPIFLVAGMAAGFSGLFGTSIAAVFFAMEVLVIGEMKFEALLPAFTASIAASTTSQALGLSKFTFILSENISFSWILLAQLLLLGLIFGIVGGLFAWCLKLVKLFLSDKIKNPIIRIALVGVGLSALFLLLYQGRYSGLGTNLIQASFHNGTIYGWDWILKFILTIVTLSAGFQGGEVTPLFSIGASLGAAMAGLFGLPVPFVAALGYAAVFGGATNTFLAPIIIGGEIFGFESIPYFFIVCTISYVFNANKSIYLQKAKTALKK